ncbi:MAG: cupredoxin domain-containing protein [Lentilitoribacter sp.]
MDNVITRRTVMTGAAATAVVLLTGSEKSIAEQPNTHDVTIKAFKFDPEHIQVKVGDTIMWTNKDLAPHTATADEFGWDTETLTKDQTKEITVTTGMEKSYFCAFHPHMKGSIEIL